MAGKFLPLEEAARQLGVTVDEINRLVDRKELFPIRDGATQKFKVEEIERIIRERAEPQEPSGLSLELELDEPAPAASASPPASAAGEELVLADDLALADSVSLGGPAATPAADLELPAAQGEGDSIFATDDPAAAGDPAHTMAMPAKGAGSGLALDDLELDLDSIVAQSSPALPAEPSKPPALPKPPAAADSGTLAVDLSGIDLSLGSGVANSNATGSLVLGSGAAASDPAGLSGSLADAGSALSGALDSGLSLEDADAAASGIDLGIGDDVSLGDSGKTALAGSDDFELGGDDDSASVVIATDSESGDSSFFGGGSGGDSSAFSGDVDLGPDGGGAGPILMPPDVATVPDAAFSGLQIAGLVCCALLLLTGAFLMMDLVSTMGSSETPSLTGPLLTPLAEAFGWR